MAVSAVIGVAVIQPATLSAQTPGTFFQIPGSLVQVPGSLVQITIGLGAGVWGINASNEIFKFSEQVGVF